MGAPVTGVVLAGGAASRYGGRPKGLERVGGRRIVDRVAGALARVADSLLVIANDPAAAGWLPEARVAGDVRPGLGSLGGIHAALVHAGGPVLVVAWDMPFVPVPLLWELRRLGCGGAADAAVPESDSRRGVEPLCAYYGPACREAIERRLDAGDHRVVSFYDDVRVARLGADVVARFGDPAVMFMNVNTPEELALAEDHARHVTPAAADGGGHRAQA
ncbi:MAG TPA: molybdenum cofactor guanylyltransferase [Gemmatimonadaceae bacterium]|nr:molybdenum cofactor guanylyltransferase [Gemmatimonadaceae bacterium]